MDWTQKVALNDFRKRATPASLFNLRVNANMYVQEDENHQGEMQIRKEKNKRLLDASRLLRTSSK